MIYLFFMLMLFAATISWIIASLDKGTGTAILKGILITGLMYISLCLFFSFENVKGWATTSVLPERFALQSFVVKEPNRRRQQAGAIYLWTIPESNSNKCPPGLICIRSDEDGAPRSYKMPYTKEMHERMIEIGKKMAEGETIIVEKNIGRKGRKNDSPDADELEFYNLPDFLEELRKD